MADARRKAEIEAKRAKLQELRLAREARKTILAADRESQGDNQKEDRPSSRAQLEDLVSSLLAPSSRDTASPGLYDSRSSQASDGIQDHQDTNNTRAPSSQPVAQPITNNSFQFPDFVDVERELFELSASKSTITYNKAVQTTPNISTTTGTDHSPDQSTGGVGTSNIRTPSPSSSNKKQLPTEAELRASILADLASESTAAQLESDEQLLRGLSYDELQAVYASSDFASFLESSSKIVQRALSDRYDYLRDYSLSATADDIDASESRHVRFVCSFQDDRWTKNRSVTDVDWSYKFPELVLASYNKNPLAVNDPDGVVCVWNLHLRERPEFVFHSQSDVLSAIFSPFQPNTIIGGTYSGQVLIWDTRAKHAPVLKTPLSASGHTHPVYSLHVVGTQNAHNLVSASTDGMICTWLMDMPARPQETLELVYPSHAKTDEVSVTCLGSPHNETGTLYVGTEEGPIFVANRFDRAGTKAGLVHNEVYRSHSGPITGLDFHPIRGPVDFGDLFLTSGVDWTVKLWRARAGVVDSQSRSNVTRSTSTGISGSAGGASKTTGGAGGIVNSVKSTSTTNATSSSTSAAAAASSISPLATFEGYDDYVTDIKWHPTHPAVFASVDGSGHFDIWNLNIDTEVPAVSTVVGIPPNRSSSSQQQSQQQQQQQNVTSPSGADGDPRMPPPGLNKLAWDRGGISSSSSTTTTTSGLNAKSKSQHASSSEGFERTDNENTTESTAQKANATTRTVLPGSKVAIGSSDGRLYVYDVSEAIVGSNDSDWDSFRKTCMTISQRGLGGTWAM